MARTQLNIDCSSQELRSWKKIAIDAGISLASWVRAKLNENGEGGSVATLLPPDKPLSDYQKFWNKESEK